MHNAVHEDVPLDVQSGSEKTIRSVIIKSKKTTRMSYLAHAV